nr:hypothetical protein [Acidimicrobiia bacterium]
ASDHEGEGDPFDSFVEGVTASKPEVTAPYVCDVNEFCPDDSPSAGATVRYQSPSRGEITFGWTPEDAAEPLPPLTVDGEEQDLHPDGLRWDAPYASSDFDSGIYQAELDGATLDLDFEKGERRTTR